jgi:signal transduction histidine kinase
VPLIAKGAPLGSMCVATRCEREFDAAARDLLYAIGSQIAVAIENARLYAELQRKERLRGELLRKVIAAQEEERKRIARDLHDDTSQALTALLYAVDEALELRDPAEIRQTLQGMRTVSQRTLDGVHKLIFDLRPSMLDHLGWCRRSAGSPSRGSGRSMCGC